MEVPDAWRIRERVLRRWDRRKGEVWEEFSPLEIKNIVSFVYAGGEHEPRVAR